MVETKNLLLESANIRLAAVPSRRGGINITVIGRLSASDVRLLRDWLTLRIDEHEKRNG